MTEKSNKEEKKPVIRLCFFCKSFSLTLETPGYSEYTPGDSFSMSCDLGHWYFSGYRSEEDFYKAVNAAGNCRDFRLDNNKIEKGSHT